MNATNEGHRNDTQMPRSLLTKLNRLSETAKVNPKRQFQNIAHLITEEMLTWSFQQLRKKASAGVDGVTAKDYEKDLETNIKHLYGKMVDGQYRAQPLRRDYMQE